MGKDIRNEHAWAFKVTNKCKKERDTSVFLYLCSNKCRLCKLLDCHGVASHISEHTNSSKKPSGCLVTQRNTRGQS